jgi:hypothetical protein
MNKIILINCNMRVLIWNYLSLNMLTKFKSLKNNNKMILIKNFKILQVIPMK